MTVLPSTVFVCPVCGPRDEGEFRYGGDATVGRPDISASDAAWAAYLYVRENPRGLSREYWVHARGCGTWLVLERDTQTQAIHSVTEVTP